MRLLKFEKYSAVKFLHSFLTVTHLTLVTFDTFYALSSAIFAWLLQILKKLFKGLPKCQSDRLLLIDVFNIIKTWTTMKIFLNSYSGSEVVGSSPATFLVFARREIQQSLAGSQITET